MTGVKSYHRNFPARINIHEMQPFVLIGMHFLLIFLIYFVFYQLHIFPVYPDNETLLRWDAGWYKSIVEKGYVFIPNGQSNLAFFPFFAIIWKFLHLSPVGVSLLNLFFLISGILILKRTLLFGNSMLLLSLSFPSLFFCYVPYSEALFFFSCAVFLYGLRWDFKFAVIGLFIAGLTRSISMLFIPIFLFILLLNIKRKKKGSLQIGHTLILIFTSFLSTIFSYLIQFYQTGQLYGLFAIQKYWFRVLAMPEFPLTTWDGLRLIWLDGLAFLTGLMAICLVAKLIIKRIQSSGFKVSVYFLFSIGYISLICLVSLFYSITDLAGGTSLFSLNRFVFATAFFPVFVLYGLRITSRNRKNAVLFFLIALLTGLLLKWPDFVTGIGYYSCILLYCILFLTLTNRKINKFSFPILYLINIVAQVYLFSGFLNGLWIG